MNSYLLGPIEHNGNELTTLRYVNSDLTQELPFRFTILFGGYFVGHQIFLGAKSVEAIKAKLKPGLKYQLERSRDNMDGCMIGPIPPLPFEKPTPAEIEYWGIKRA